MVSKIRSMKNLQENIRTILKDERLLCDMFDGVVEMGKMDEQKLFELRKIAGIPNLYQSEIVTLKKEDIMSNPYLKNINIPNVSSNEFKLAKRRIRPRLITKYGFQTRDLNTFCKSNSYFTCDERLDFPGLVEGNGMICWMTVEPFEIKSFESFIKEATGNILLIGCGLGYVAYMLSEKQDVSSVTVIDNNSDVLNLFNTYILPQFKNKNKIKTIQSDGIEYLKNNTLNMFDYINVDIWRDTMDMIYPYLRCLEIEKSNPTVKFSYWLEEELREEIQKNLLVAISEFESDGFLISKICEDIVKVTSIRTYDDIRNLLDIKDIRAFLYKWYVNNLHIVEKQESIDMNLLNSFFSKFSQFNEDEPSYKVYSKK